VLQVDVQALSISRRGVQCLGRHQGKGRAANDIETGQKGLRCLEQSYMAL
jgi:hypothetical protein